MERYEILDLLQKQVDALIFERDQRTREEGLRNALAIVISILRTQYSPPGDPVATNQGDGSNSVAPK